MDARFPPKSGPLDWGKAPISSTEPTGNGDRSRTPDLPPTKTEPISLSSMKLFRPTFDRRIPHRLTQDVLQHRLLPLIADIAKRKVELRQERAGTIPHQLEDLLAEAGAVAAAATNPSELFDRTQNFTSKLEQFLGDVDYVTFGQVGLISQLRALSVTLRTSRLLWSAVRAGYAFRDPELQRAGMKVLRKADTVLTLASQGVDVKADLDALEHEYFALTEALEEKTGDNLGLPDRRAFSVARQAWRYRTRAEAEILARDGREGPLTNPRVARRPSRKRSASQTRRGGAGPTRAPGHRATAGANPGRAGLVAGSDS